MRKWERVKAAIGHREADRIPKGEVVVSPELVRQILEQPEASNSNGHSCGAAGEYAGEITGDYAEETAGAYVGETAGESAREHAEWDSLRRFLDVIDADLVVVPAEERAPEASGVKRLGQEVYMDVWGREFTHFQDCRYYHGTAWELERDLNDLHLPQQSEYTARQAEFFAANSDLFVFGLVDGGFQLAASLLGFEKFLVNCETNTEKIGALISRLEEFQTEVALKLVNAGAKGIIIGDDFAYAKSTLVSPQVLNFTLIPALRQAVETLHGAGVPVFLHCDGNISGVLPMLAETKLDGLQGLESAAGMNLREVKRNWGDRFCLMGNLDISLLENQEGPEHCPAALDAAVREAIDAAAAGGGYIFGTSAGLSRSINLERLRRAYQLAGRLGSY